MQNRYVFFDADDTLWENEWFFRHAEDRFVKLVSEAAPDKSEQEIRSTLAQAQEDNIPIFGYGSKTYLIGMLDCVCRLCGDKTAGSLYPWVNGIIRELAVHPVQIIPGVKETLEVLSRRYRLAVATKGDLREQIAKFRKSGLAPYFHHIEVMENKDEENYVSMARKLDIAPEDIVMVGNSVKSDIAPVVNLGGIAIHVPHEIVWEHEKMEMPESKNIFEAKNIEDLPKILSKSFALAQ